MALTPHQLRSLRRIVAAWRTPTPGSPETAEELVQCYQWAPDRISAATLSALAAAGLITRLHPGAMIVRPTAAGVDLAEDPLAELIRGLRGGSCPTRS